MHSETCCPAAAERSQTLTAKSKTRQASITCVLDDGVHHFWYDYENYLVGRAVTGAGILALLVLVVPQILLRSGTGEHNLRGLESVLLIVAFLAIPFYISIKQLKADSKKYYAITDKRILIARANKDGSWDNSSIAMTNVKSVRFNSFNARTGSIIGDLVIQTYDGSDKFNSKKETLKAVPDGPALQAMIKKAAADRLASSEESRAYGERVANTTPEQIAAQKKKVQRFKWSCLMWVIIYAIFFSLIGWLFPQHHHHLFGH
jgi:hypothetical protein